MAERWIVNASPLIVLAKVGMAELLVSIPDSLGVPRVVADEVLRGPAEDPASQLVASGRLAIVEAPPPPAAVAGWDLGPGESSVLALACAEPGSIAVIDDAAARRCAHSLDVPTLGTLSVLVQAKRAGLLAEIAPVLARIREAGLYLSDRLVREVLEQARE
jgi:predicted nucleic acid-binding protein